MMKSALKGLTDKKDLFNSFLSLEAIKYNAKFFVALLSVWKPSLMSARKYLSVKTRIMQKAVNWFVFQIDSLFSKWYKLLLKGISEQTITILLLLKTLNAFRLLGKRFDCWLWTSIFLHNLMRLRWKQKFIFLIRKLKKKKNWYPCNVMTKMVSLWHQTKTL